MCILGGEGRDNVYPTQSLFGKERDVGFSRTQNCYFGVLKLLRTWRRWRRNLMYFVSVTSGPDVTQLRYTSTCRSLNNRNGDPDTSIFLPSLIRRTITCQFSFYSDSLTGIRSVLRRALPKWYLFLLPRSVFGGSVISLLHYFPLTHWVLRSRYFV